MGSRSASLCADALKRAGSPQAPRAHQRAVDYANALMRTVRDPRLRKLFPNAPVDAALFETTPIPADCMGCRRSGRPCCPPGGRAPRP